MNKFSFSNVTVVIALLGLAVGLGYAAVYVDPKLIVGGIVAVLLCGLILNNPLLGMFLLVFFLPFERIGSVDVAGVTIRISQVIAILTICAWVIRGFALNKFKLRPNPLVIPSIIFICINIVALINAPNLQRSILVLVFTVFTIAISIAVPNIIRHKQQVEMVLRILLIGMTVVSLFGIYQFLGDLAGLPTSLTGLRAQYTKAILGFPRVQSTALEPLYFANYLLIPLSIAMAFVLSRATTIKRWLLIVVLILGGINFVLTVSRGGYIALAVALGILVLGYWRESIRPRNVITVFIVGSIVAITAFRFFNVGEQIDSFVNHVTDLFGGASYAERVETFDTAFEIWNQHPWIGIGAGGFGPYSAYQALEAPAEGYKIVNNEYIELLAETGVLGLSIYVIMILIIFVRSIKAWRTSNDGLLRAALAGLLCAFIGILVQYNTFSILYIMHIWFTIGMIIAVQNLLLAQSTSDVSTDVAN